MRRVCQSSGEEFTVLDDLIPIYDQLGVPVPTLSPRERSRRRLAYRNTRSLYKRKCNGTGKDIVALFSPDKEVPVFDERYWWTDEWDPRAFARDFDFSRPFFEQFYELDQLIPRIATNGGDNENCPYTSHSGWNRDCYLIFYSDHNRSCFYSTNCFYSQDCADSYYLTRSELCYECLNSENCYNCRYLENCRNCSDSWFLDSCIGCRNCFGCVGLRNQEYHIFNKRYSKDEYLGQLEALRLTSRESVQKHLEQFEKFKIESAYKILTGYQNEDCTGDYLIGCKNVQNSFNVEYSRDCAYIFDCQKCINCYDVDGWGGTGSELLYECQTVGEGANRVLFSDHCFSGVSNLYYCHQCMNSHDLFGCGGLRRAEYCILNKQYTKDEYLKLAGKIVEHMKETGEWGEFFPIQYSTFGYNETVAHERYPVEEQEAKERGWNWHNEGQASQPSASLHLLPDDIRDTEESICKEVLTCEQCNRAYKFQLAEYRLNIKLQQPLPNRCHSCRHERRSRMVMRVV